MITFNTTFEHYISDFYLYPSDQMRMARELTNYKLSLEEVGKEIKQHYNMLEANEFNIPYEMTDLDDYVF